MSPEQIRIKSNKINLDGYVTISSLANGTTNIDGDCLMTGTVECSKLTASNSRPYIELFNNNNTEMALDATKNNMFGVGDAIRLKRDRYNYVCVSNGNIRFYLGNNNTSSDYGDVLKVDNNGIYYKGQNLTVMPSHKHNDEVLWPQRVNCDILGGNNSGTILMQASLDGNGKNLGHSTSKFNQLSAVRVWADGGSITSDKKYKENIIFLDENKTSKSLNSDDSRLLSTTENTDNLTITDLYNFVKDNLALCEYNYNEEYLGELYNKEIPDTHLGFIAQDLINTKVEKVMLRTDEENNIGYNLNSYVSVLAGALQKTIDKVEKLEKALTDNNIPIPQ